jgi:hypothetical protein
MTTTAGPIIITVVTDRDTKRTSEQTTTEKNLTTSSTQVVGTVRSSTSTRPTVTTAVTSAPIVVVLTIKEEDVTSLNDVKDGSTTSPSVPSRTSEGAIAQQSQSSVGDAAVTPALGIDVDVIRGVAGGVIGFILLLGAIAAVAVFWSRLRAARQGTGPTDDTPESGVAMSSTNTPSNRSSISIGSYGNVPHAPTNHYDLGNVAGPATASAGSLPRSSNVSRYEHLAKVPAGTQYSSNVL